MAKIFGKVENFDLEASEVNEDCVMDCFEANDCLLAFMDSENHCLLFNFNDTEHLTVSETRSEDKLVVAFKANISTDPSISSCPLYPDLNLTVTLPNGDQIVWEKKGNQFEFKKCIGDWKMFKRSEDLTVCMQTISVAAVIRNVEVARKRCNDLGGYKLIGVGSLEELIWIKKKHDIANNGGYSGYWLDGKREEISSGMLNTNFEFSDGLTVLNKTLYDEYTGVSGSTYGKEGRRALDCLIFCKPTGRMMYDVACDAATTGYGFVCGYQLV
uniref:CW domain-containing protein n=1 Tax=Caenorhabditis tropicalis TaxID=1561998 RepID=A0A1I7UIL6_9PELO